MSTAALVPGSQVSVAISTEPGHRPLTFQESLSRTLLGRCSHNHSWPVTHKPFVYPKGYDSHQTCTKCGDERFYNSLIMTPGPSFIRMNIPTR